PDFGFHRLEGIEGAHRRQPQKRDGLRSHSEAGLDDGLFQRRRLNNARIVFHRYGLSLQHGLRRTDTDAASKRVLDAFDAAAAGHTADWNNDFIHVCPLMDIGGFHRARNSELVTTLTLDAAMAAPAMIGLSRPRAASGMPITL